MARASASTRRPRLRSTIAAFTAAQAADPYLLRPANLANVYDATFQAAVAASQAALALARQHLADSRLLAPADGG